MSSRRDFAPLKDMRLLLTSRLVMPLWSIRSAHRRVQLSLFMPTPRRERVWKDGFSLRASSTGRQPLSPTYL